MSYTDNDFRLYHSWGKKPEQKAREREYNHSYYARNKEKWKKYAQNAVNAVRNWAGYDDEERMNQARKTHDQRFREEMGAQKVLGAYAINNRDAGDDPMFDKLVAERDRRGRVTEEARKAAGLATAAYNKTPLAKARAAISAGKNFLDSIVSAADKALRKDKTYIVSDRNRSRTVTKRVWKWQ